MGQYYTPTIMKNDDSFEVESALNSWDYDTGSKLMEHSYIGVSFISIATSLLSNGPKRIAWIGDYADFAEFNECKGKPISREQFEGAYKSVWNDKDINPLYKQNLNPVVDMSKGYLINHTAKEFINLENYMKLVQGWEYKVNPLPLLTAVGNGNGGGDYRDDCFYDAVGDWAFDSIEYKLEITDGELAEFEELTIYFAEGPRDFEEEAV
jgi:hypothetical protein